MDPDSLIDHLRAQGIRDERVLAAMRSVPRDAFVRPALRHHAWEDAPLPIGEGQTISQPYIVALMSEALELRGDERVLEIGTGSGYQTAILSQLCQEVWSVEILGGLLSRARTVLDSLGIANVHLRQSDGARGWPEAAPFDGILCAAAPLAIPEPLVAQLRGGGTLVLPVGPAHAQELVRVRRVVDGELQVERLTPVRFVPMTGSAERL